MFEWHFSADEGNPFPQPCFDTTTAGEEPTQYLQNFCGRIRSCYSSGMFLVLLSSLRRNNNKQHKR